MKNIRKADVVLVSMENGFQPSLGLLSLDAFLDEAGISAEILYPSVTGDSVAETVKKITCLKPSVVGFGGLFADRFIVRDIIKELTPYRKNFKIVIGGNMVTPIPEFMLNKLSADIGVIGEGELIFTELVTRILNGKDYSDVKGIVFKDGGKVVNTGPGKYLENLDDLPPFNYEKIPMEHFIKAYKFYKTSTRNSLYTPLTRSGAVSTGRGCPFKCNFCYHYNKYRLIKIPKIIEQVKELKEKFNINLLRFLDDVTLVNKKRTLELCGALMREKIKLPYTVNAHLSNLDEEMARVLKESGCIGISLGLESGSQRILDRINKGVKVEQIKKGLDLLRKYKISWSGCVQIGQLGETEHDVKLTKDLYSPYIDEFSTMSVAITTPYPGTPLYHYGIKTGLIKDDEYLFNGLGDLRKLVVNFSKLSDRRARYLRLKLTFDFDIKKQKATVGRWRAYLVLIKKMAAKLAVRIVNICVRERTRRVKV